MSVADLAIIAGLVFAWGTLSARLERFDMTAPLLFTGAGVLLAHGPLAVLEVTPSRAVVKALAEGTLALVLFSDASRVAPAQLKADMRLYLRVLGIGLPLTIAMGTLLALALVSGNIWLALLTGAALAPTDAALGAGVMVNPAVPARIRRLINVESGLNDGIATPVVSVAIAGAGTAEHVAGAGAAAAVAGIAVAVAIGVGVGGAGGWLVAAASRRGWAAGGFAGATVLGLAVCLYATAVALDGNGFIAAFVGGLSFAAVVGRRDTQLVPYVEETGAVASLLVWLMFGILVVGALRSLTWEMALYAVLSLTVVRMVPVAVSLAGARLGRVAVAFVGWFGPRGLASVVFALLALEDLRGPVVRPAVTVIALTVLVSVIAHGVTAQPLARRYGPRLTPAMSPAPASEIPERRLIRREPPVRPGASRRAEGTGEYRPKT